MINKQIFIFIDADAQNIILRLDAIKYPVLWNYNGMYGLIPFPKIQNAFECWKDLHVNEDKIPTGAFCWRDTIPISPQIANALLGEDKDDKCTYRGKGSSDSGGTGG